MLMSNPEFCLQFYRVDTMTMLSARQLHELAALAKRRVDGLPVQYVISEWDFRDLTLQMEPPVFIPRPETEVRRS